MPSEPYTGLTNSPMSKDTTIFIGLVVRGALVVDVLKDKATELVERWPALGGKFVTKTTPYSFTTGDGIVDFQARQISSSLADYFPLDFKVEDSDKPSYKSFKNGSTGDDAFHFNSIKALNMAPENVFALRVTVLTDATLVGFRVPHHLCDGQSAFGVVKAYCDLVCNRLIPKLIPSPDITIPLSRQVEGTDSLPVGISMENARYVNPAENFAFGNLYLAQHVGYLFGQSIGRLIGLVKQTEERYIHLSGKLVQRWQDDCQKELEGMAKDGKLSEGAGIELTKNDVITAWYLKMAYTLTPSDDGPIDLCYNFNFRPSLRKTEPGSTYLHNSFYNIRTHWTSLREFQNSSLAQIALAIRLCVIRNKQPSSIRTALQFYEAHIADALSLGAPGTRYSFIPFFSSWTTFDYYGLDLSGALPASNHTEDQGKVVFTQPFTAIPMGVKMRPFALSLKDGNGGYWIRSALDASSWKAHEG